MFFFSKLFAWLHQIRSTNLKSFWDLGSQDPALFAGQGYYDQKINFRFNFLKLLLNSTWGYEDPDEGRSEQTFKYKHNDLGHQFIFFPFFKLIN